jgi:hypothetical protein
LLSAKEEKKISSLDPQVMKAIYAGLMNNSQHFTSGVLLLMVETVESNARTTEQIGPFSVVQFDSSVGKVGLRL